MDVLRNRAALPAALIVAALFFGFAGDGLRAYFTPDDMMNLYLAWSTPVWTADRPAGALVYRGLFALFGLDPAPYRVLAFALLAANLALTYLFCLRISRSREIAALACLLAAYHAHLADLYYSTGTIYDLLCFFFFFLAFAWYLSIREDGGVPTWRQTAGLLALYAMALASKEIAVTLPVLVALYEALERWGRLEPARTSRGRWRFVWAALLISLPYAAYKTLGARRMTANPDYALHLDVHAMMAAWKHYLYDLFYQSVQWNSLKIALLFGLLLAAALVARRRDMLFAWCFVVVAAAPVLFIVPRGFFAIYLTLPGWYLLGASLLAWGRDAVVRRRRRAMAGLQARPDQIALFLIVAALLIPLHRHEKPLGNAWVPAAHSVIGNAIFGLERCPPVSRGARVLILKDPLPEDEWMLTFIFRLYYRDNDIRVDRAKYKPELAAQPARAQYSRFFVMDDRGLTEAR